MLLLNMIIVQRGFNIDPNRKILRILIIFGRVFPITLVIVSLWNTCFSTRVRYEIIFVVVESCQRKGILDPTIDCNR